MPKSLAITKHFQIARELRQRIELLGPGNPLPTHQELRQEYGASQATVDRALKRLRREGLIYRPAGTRRMLVREVIDPAAMRVCILRPDWPSVMYDVISRTVVAAAPQDTWRFTYHHYRSMAKLDVEAVTESNDAVVMMTTQEPMPPHLSRMLARPTVPLVLVQDHRPGLRATSVAVNDRQMASVAVRYLVELGHRRVMLALPTRTTGTMQEATAGWRQVLEEAGERDVERLIVDTDNELETDARRSMYERIGQWLASPHEPFSAVYFANSAVALGGLRAFHEMGLNVPGDVSVVVADALVDEAAFMTPAATATTLDMHRFGGAVVELINQQVRGEAEPRQALIDAELVVRRSTQPFRNRLV